MPVALLKKDGKTLSFTINSGDVILEALEKQNYLLPRGCLSGTCGICKIRILEGAENIERPDALEAVTLENAEKDIRLSCRARFIKNQITFETT